MKAKSKVCSKAAIALLDRSDGKVIVARLMIEVADMAASFVNKGCQLYLVCLSVGSTAAADI
jgi:hypothetical protein